MKPEETPQDSLTPLLYFVFAPVAFTFLLMRYVPARVPTHMDLWGNITRWGLKADFIPTLVLYVFVASLTVWAAVIGKYRGQER